MRACAFAAATYKYAGSSQRAVSPFGLGPEVATHRTERDARERKAQLSAVLPGQSEYLSSSHFKPGNGMALARSLVFASLCRPHRGQLDRCTLPIAPLTR
jgi:hypothetical protein